MAAFLVELGPGADRMGNFTQIKIEKLRSGGDGGLQGKIACAFATARAANRGNICKTFCGERIGLGPVLFPFWRCVAPYRSEYAATHRRTAGAPPAAKTRQQFARSFFRYLQKPGQLFPALAAPDGCQRQKQRWHDVMMNRVMHGHARLVHQSFQQAQRVSSIFSKRFQACFCNPVIAHFLHIPPPAALRQNCDNLQLKSFNSWPCQTVVYVIDANIKSLQLFCGQTQHPKKQGNFIITEEVPHSDVKLNLFFQTGQWGVSS